MGEVWESAGWEPREDQLSWQQYEVAAADGQDTRERQGRQGLGRRAPLITDRATSRAFLVKLSTLPWSEQRKIKEKMDQALDVKKARKTEKPADHSIRQSVLPNQLELRQVGRSVKYMKAVEREAVKEAEEVGREEVVRGTLSGEWEHEFSFVCSVCAIEYDDVLEIMHHKWEAHPHCLVTHVSLKEGTVRPPALLYPQVPALVYSAVKGCPHPMVRLPHHLPHMSQHLIQALIFLYRLVRAWSTPSPLTRGPRHPSGAPSAQRASPPTLTQTAATMPTSWSVVESQSGIQHHPSKRENSGAGGEKEEA